MSNLQNIQTRNERQFRQIAIRVLKQAGFTDYVPEKKLFQPQIPYELLEKNSHIYCLATLYSRQEQYTSRAILNVAETLIQTAKKVGYFPLIVVGGVLTQSLVVLINDISTLAVILDVENLLYMAQGNRELHNEMVAQLPYSISNLVPRKPDYLPVPDWNNTLSGQSSWRNDTIVPIPASPIFPGQQTWQNTQDTTEQFLEHQEFPKAVATTSQESIISPIPVCDWVDDPSKGDYVDEQGGGAYAGVMMEDISDSMSNRHSEPLSLTFKSTGETRKFTGATVKVGRDPSNECSISDISTVSRHHATFAYEYQMWFLIDNNSVNGTFLNGQCLVPGEKYQLASNDEIAFAKKCTVIFDKQTHMQPPVWAPAEEKTDWKKNQQNMKDPVISARLGNGKSSFLTKIVFEKLQKDIRNWKGGKETNAAAYEKLCTQTLMRLFADELTLWREQAKSNSDLFRFDLICKIKRDNHKDFWEMAERYFNSKYIIFEFKNYSGKVTQKEIYTTVRYLYTKAMRGVAVIISPNGMDENAGKAIRGVLRDEGKLILSLTNAELIHMLQMKENGEDPADYLSDKLDELLIDLEK